MLIGLVAADGGGCTRDGRILTPWQGAGPGFTLIAPLVPGPLGCANSGAPYSQTTGICGTATEFEVVASPQSEVRIIFPWNDPEPGLAVHSTLPATRSFVSPEQYSFVTGTGWVMVGDAVCGVGSFGCITGPATVVPEYPLGLPVLAILTIIAYAAIKRRTTKKPN